MVLFYTPWKDQKTSGVIEKQRRIHFLRIINSSKRFLVYNRFRFLAPCQFAWLWPEVLIRRQKTDCCTHNIFTFSSIWHNVSGKCIRKILYKHIFIKKTNDFLNIKDTFENLPISWSLYKNNMFKISHWNTFYFLRHAHESYAKSLFTNIQEQQNMLRISLLFRKFTNFTCK